MNKFFKAEIFKREIRLLEYQFVADNSYEHQSLRLLTNLPLVFYAATHKGRPSTLCVEAPDAINFGGLVLIKF